MTARRVQHAAHHAALGALIAARRAELGVHVVEPAADSFDVFLRLSGPFADRGAAVRAARHLQQAIEHLLPPGPPTIPVGHLNPRPRFIPTNPPKPPRNRSRTRTEQGIPGPKPAATEQHAVVEPGPGTGGEP